jgi:hypothetical protein
MENLKAIAYIQIDEVCMPLEANVIKTILFVFKLQLFVFFFFFFSFFNLAQPN